MVRDPLTEQAEAVRAFNIQERNYSFHQKLMELNGGYAKVKAKNKALKQYFAATRNMVL